MILAADIGGTKSIFACCHFINGELCITTKKRYLNNEFGSLDDVLKTFIFEYSEREDFSQIEVACFGLAGPIIDNKCYMVNLGWNIDKKQLQISFPNITSIELCNDLEAVGYGMTILSGEDILCLTPELLNGNNKKSEILENNCGILAPGTGLGEAFLLGGRVFSSEGSHSDFGPRSIEQVRLWQFLHSKFDHVSYDRILSGPGLCQLVYFLMKEMKADRVDFNVIPEEITRRAMKENCTICQGALKLFVNILGSEAGNMAIRSLTYGGIYLGGGIPPKILPALQGGDFINSFRNKGRFSNFMKGFPVFVIMNSQTALYGTALLAAKNVYPNKCFNTIIDVKES